MSPICLLLVPALVYGKLIIDIDITDVDHPLLDVRGERTSVITDKERETFKIGDEQLKKAIAKATNDTKPNDVSVKSTGKGLDLHKNYKWDDVKRTVKPILKIKHIKCDGETKALEKSDDFVESEWKLHGNISIEVEYDIYIHDETSPNFNISSPLGGNFKNSSEYHFGKTVQAQKCNVDIVVSYYTTLTGRVAANYPAKRQNHYYWGYDVNYILMEATLPTRIVNNQTISISYFKESIV